MSQTDRDELATRLADIERRLSMLEQVASGEAVRAEGAGRQAAPTGQPAGAGADQFWALAGLRPLAPPGGAVLLAGLVDLPGGEHYEWQQAFPVDGVLESEPSLTAPTLAALGHPARLLILREVLRGTRSAAELQAVQGIETSGQLYHHIRQLVAAGWLHSSGRARYTVPPSRLIPLLVILACAQR